ncbi:protein-L-isoaspartate O-methyltransferase [Amylibacter sp. IMCC11727]|uniref:protein-L-isoaspartate O-methyltransferase family protein n=1 Tax=Amylibacter sp. IMCC11727 TaxID=3039851 RepID=UPI00244E1CE3|nr:protein-L-isoaspartate O-methyltransferase [Amylibacter sp. IMCC11727]WGI23104.1 protein-L-isoaspartate O-methyltransferase [Amylibacter sp. IMCC11727]
MMDFSAARTTMVDCQVRPSDVTKYPIIDALLTVPREEFVPAAKRSVAYMGEHIALDRSRVILDARTFAKMLDAVNIQPDELVLDLGCGYGYSSAVMAKMAEAVVGVEPDEAMANEAAELLAANGADNAMVVHGELAKGAAKHGPYCVIVLQGAAETIPAAILDQLKVGGRIVAIRQTGGMGQCKIGLKRENGMDWRGAFSAAAPTLPGFEKEAEFTFG